MLRTTHVKVEFDKIRGVYIYIYIFTMMRILHCECEDKKVDDSDDNAEVMDLKWKEDEIKSHLSYAQFLYTTILKMRSKTRE
jgi:hypothetical protein